MTYSGWINLSLDSRLWRFLASCRAQRRDFAFRRLRKGRAKVAAWRQRRASIAPGRTPRGLVGRRAPLLFVDDDCDFNLGGGDQLNVDQTPTGIRTFARLRRNGITSDADDAQLATPLAVFKRQRRPDDRHQIVRAFSIHPRES
jgi:hypothetical protein